MKFHVETLFKIDQDINIFLKLIVTKIEKTRNEIKKIIDK